MVVKLLSLTVRENHRQRMFENRVLRRISESKKASNEAG
jgi:hypothetical protein